MVSEGEQSLLGLCHVALNVVSEIFDDTLTFYTDLVGMRIDWQPDADSVYLTSGADNLALHRVSDSPRVQSDALDHIGFMLAEPQDVDAWQHKLRNAGIVIEKAAKTHRDGARSFYCRDPGGTLVQFLFHPSHVGRALP